MVRPRKRAEPAADKFVTEVEKPDDEATVVRSRKPAEPLLPAFSIEVRRKAPGAETAPPDVRPFFKDEIIIGRGSRQVPVDLRLEGDLEVSRQHATLAKNGDQYTLTCKGANPIAINDEREVAAGESATLKPGDKMTVCSYELMIQV